MRATPAGIQQPFRFIREKVRVSKDKSDLVLLNILCGIYKDKSDVCIGVVEYSLWRWHSSWYVYLNLHQRWEGCKGYFLFKTLLVQEFYRFKIIKNDQHKYISWGPSTSELSLMTLKNVRDNTLGVGKHYPELETVAMWPKHICVSTNHYKTLLCHL